MQVISLSDDAARVGGDLKPGERIVSLGAHLLHDGQPVRVGDQNAVAAAGAHQ
ncbi:hypothetical protein D3C71_2186050 [compost metagenome]